MSLAAFFKGALGLKPESPARVGPKIRKPIPRRSKKRAAYMASAARKVAVAHMLDVKAMSCVCCGSPGPNEAHHVKDDKQPRNDMRVIPLCTECHRGKNGYHNATETWRATYGLDVDYLAVVADALAGELNK